MARPTTYATPICIAVTVLAAIGIAVGIATGEPLYPIGFMVPAVAYEVYRTEGRSTTWASWTLAVLIVALFVVNLFDVDFDLRQILGTDITYLGGRSIPLGDIKVVFPTAMAALAAVLWARTRGVYTMWLAAVILVTSGAVVFITAPEAVGDVIDMAR